MAMCKSYENMNPIEQKEMVSQMAHLIRTNEYYFKEVQQLIRIANVHGLFDRVKFGSQVNSKQV